MRTRWLDERGLMLCLTMRMHRVGLRASEVGVSSNSWALVLPASGSPYACCRLGDIQQGRCWLAARNGPSSPVLHLLMVKEDVYVEEYGPVGYLGDETPNSQIRR